MQLDVGPTEKSVLYAICLQANSNGVTWRRRAGLASAAGISESTLKRKLAGLRKLGIIKTERTPGASKNSISEATLNKLVKEQEYGGAHSAPSMVPNRHHRMRDKVSLEEQFAAGDDNPISDD